MLGHRPPSLVLFLLLLAEAGLQDNRHVPVMRKSFSVVQAGLELSFPNAREQSCSLNTFSVQFSAWVLPLLTSVIQPIPSLGT